MREVRLFDGMLGETKVGLWVEDREGGGLRLIGQDISERLKADYGDADYEYWLDIPRSDMKRLEAVLREELRKAGKTPTGALAFDYVIQMYAGDAGAFEKFRTLCQRGNIQAVFGCRH